MPNQDKLQKSMLPNWNFITNSQPNSVDRIWVGWNPEKVNVTTVICNSQIIHVKIENIDHSMVLFFFRKKTPWFLMLLLFMDLIQSMKDGAFRVI